MTPAERREYMRSYRALGPMGACSNCGHPITTGGSSTLDARCYHYQRRHNRLPPPEPLKRRRTQREG